MRTRSSTKKVDEPEPDIDEETGHDDVEHDVEDEASGDDNNDSADDECHSFTIPFPGKKDIHCELRGANPGATPSMIWTHGAGGGIDNPATHEFAVGFANIAPVVVFQSNANLANRVKTYEAVMDHVNFGSALGGRSMGARAAGTIAAEDNRVEAVVLVSYPLIGQGGDLRDEILLNLPERVDVLFVIGTKDHMCPSEQFDMVRGRMKVPSWLVVAEGADHGMALKKSADTTAFRQKTGEVAAKWLKQRDSKKRVCEVRWDDEEGKAVVSPWRDDDRVLTGRGSDDEPQPKKQKVT